jgi:hypothetical protein
MVVVDELVVELLDVLELVLDEVELVELLLEVVELVVEVANCVTRRFHSAVVPDSFC